MTTYRIKSPQACTREELEGVIEAIQAQVYLTTDEHAEETWDLDKSVNGADIVDAVGINLAWAGLAPEEEIYADEAEGEQP